MTAREKKLLILVAVVITAGMAYNYWPRMDQSSAANGINGSGLIEANRLLQLQPNIINRNKAVRAELKTLQERFYSTANVETAKINLLKEVEAIAAQSNLAVLQKNMVSIHDDTIGVALEGKTNTESLIRFLYLTAQDHIGLRIYRLQIHSLTDVKQLNYQITVITMLVK
jgi:hypothetical protein